MENKNKHVRVGFSTILWAVWAIFLCAAQGVLAQDVTVPVGQEWDIDYTISGTLYVDGTANLLPGADIGVFVCAYANSVVNIRGGTVGWWIEVASTATVTLYGTDFFLDTNGNGIKDPGEIELVEGSHSINGIVGGSYANGDPINLRFEFLSGATVTLAAPGGEPLEAQLWVFPSLINRYGPLSKIWAMVRLPEGITKNDIDSEQTLVLYAKEYENVKIEASCQRIVQWCRNGTVRTTIFASFDKASLTDAVPDGEVELEVVGGLNTGQDFYGTDTIRIVSWYWCRR